MYFNLLNQPEKLIRDVSIRIANMHENRKESLKFGKAYFDGKREQGYGGYVYDGRWIDVAKTIIHRFNLNENSKYLDIGCAKGFLMSDLKNAIPKIEVYGVDISKYAKEHAMINVKENILISDCIKLPFPDNYFDAVTAINTIHNLEYEGCKTAILEMQRVCKNKNNIFIQVDAYTNEDEKKYFEDWLLTAKTYLKPEEWTNLFKEINYCGDYFWTIIGFTPD